MLFNGLEQPTPIPYLFIRLRDYFSCQYKHFLGWLFHFFGSHEVFSCSIVTYIKKKRTASILLVFSWFYVCLGLQTQVTYNLNTAMSKNYYSVKLCLISKI